MGLDKMPAEVLNLVARNLNAVDLARLAQTNRVLHNAADDYLLPAQHERLSRRFAFLKAALGNKRTIARHGRGNYETLPKAQCANNHIKDLEINLALFAQTPSQQLLVQIQTDLNNLAKDIAELPDAGMCSVQ